MNENITYDIRQKSEVPRSVILDFFARAAAKIDNYGTNGNWQITVTEDSFVLDELRKALLDLQHAALEETVAEYNKKQQDDGHDPKLLETVDVQLELENLGNNGMGNCDDNSGDEAELLREIKGMNDAERLALVRGVLATQWSYLDDFDVHEEEKEVLPSDIADNTVILERQDILDYFNLCVTLAKMDDFKRYLKTGAPLISPQQSGSKVYYGLSKEELERHAPENRLILVQQVILRAILGFPVLDPSIVVVEANRLLSSIPTNNIEGSKEKKFRDAYESYTAAMRLAYCACWDQDEG